MKETSGPTQHHKEVRSPQIKIPPQASFAVLNYISIFFTCQVQIVQTSQADEWMMQERGGEGERRRCRYMAGDTERGGGWSGLGSIHHQRRLYLKCVLTAPTVKKKLPTSCSISLNIVLNMFGQLLKKC